MDELQPFMLHLDSAQDATANMLPDKSKEKYMATYQKFMEWKEKKNLTSLSENVLMTYFKENALTLKPSTLWAQYSMLKSTLIVHNNVDIQKYTKVLAFLKKINIGFKSKKTKVLTSAEVEKFLSEAPDVQYLATKVALIFGINGACRREELCNILAADVKDFENSLILVNLPTSNTKIKRSFTITDQFYFIVKKYLALRPPNAKCDRFFLNFQNGKCTQQPIGINKFGGMAKTIATYLGLPEPESYTGHCFRRTSAKLLADAGADISTLKQHGRLKPTLLAEGYFEDSIGSKGLNSIPEPTDVCVTNESAAGIILSVCESFEEKLDEKYQSVYDSAVFVTEFKNWNGYTSEEQADLVARYFDWLTLSSVEEIAKAKTVSKIFRMKNTLPTIAHHPLLMKRLLTPHKEMGAIFCISTFVNYLKPLIIELYKSREVKVRLKLLESLMDHVQIFTDTEMKAHIIPEIGLGLQEVNQSIVHATLLCLASLVEILGPAAVIGGAKHEKFVDSLAEPRTETVKDGQNRDMRASTTTTIKIEEMEVEVEDFGLRDPLEGEESSE